MRYALIFFIAIIMNAFSTDKPLLKIEEFERHYQPDGSIIVLVGLKASNFPKGKKFSLKSISSNLNETSFKAIADIFTVRDDGMLINQYGWPLSKYFFILANFSQGEPITYRLDSEDGVEHYSEVIIPHPLCVSGADGAKISLERHGQEGEFFVLWVTGFKPEEKLKFISNSEGEEKRYDFTVSENGDFLIIIEPAISGKKRGTTSITIQRKGEALQLKAPWGEGSEVPVKHTFKLIEKKVEILQENSPLNQMRSKMIEHPLEETSLRP